MEPPFVFRDFKQIAMATSTTAEVDEEFWGEYVTAAHQFQLSARGAQTVTKGFLAHLLSLLVKCREDVTLLENQKRQIIIFFIK